MGAKLPGSPVKINLFKTKFNLNPVYKNLIEKKIARCRL